MTLREILAAARSDMAGALGFALLAVALLLLAIVVPA